ncbi:MAG: T9SS type A sorting domain-containing protein, partial [Flavobacteriales bacterium]|nr:T9SS type A sorting domain-containing protein [Flavobacteriales bacterium]
EEVWLEDRALNQFQHLNENPVYAFSTDAGNIGTRFALHFGMMAVGVDENASAAHVFAADGMVNVTVGEDIATGTIAILDMAGRTVQTAAINGSRTVVSTDLITGIYLVHVETTKGAETHRVMLR